MEPIYKSVKITDKTKTQGLPVRTQLKLILSNFTKNDAIELEANERLNEARLSNISALSNLIDKATSLMIEKGKHKVTLKLSSRFIPYLDEVTNSEYGKGRFYTFELRDNKRAIKGLDYYAILIIKRK